MLPVIGKTAIERVPPRIDNLSMGQDQPDEGQIIPIVRQLIDEERLGRFTLDMCAFDKLRAQPFGVLRAKTRQRVNPVDIAPFAPLSSFA